MDTITLKYISIISILLITISAGLPILCTNLGNTITKYINQCDALARGIFLGVAINHLLPETILHHHEHENNISMLTITSIVVYTYAILLWIEKCLPHHLKVKNISNKILNMTFLLFALSAHSIIEGYALGIGDSISGITVLLVAIISHKGIATIALGIRLFTVVDVSNKIKTILLLIFAAMTPLGIFLGMLSNTYLIDNFTIHTVANSIASGTFIYIATIHNTQLDQDNAHVSVVFFIIGVILISLVGMQFGHQH